MDNPIWQKITKAVTSAVALALFALLSYAEIYLSVAGSFFEANRLLFGTSFVALLLLALQIALTLYFGVSLFLSLRGGERPSGILALAGELAVIAMGIAMPIIFYYGRATEAVTFLAVLPYFLVGLLVAVALFVIAFAKKKVVALLLVIAMTVLSVGGVAAGFAFGGTFRIEENPAVFDNGTDFSVVWCTSAPSIGYLEYTHDGETYVVYDAEDGKYRADSRVHTVRVPYDHLYGATYRVGAAQVKKNAAKNSVTGDFITSREYRFASKITGTSVKLLSVTDWHEDTTRLCKAAAACGEYDVLLMMGDAVRFVNEREDLIDNVILPAGKIGGGVKPIVFARGNHEPRGKYASELKSMLGYDDYYFTATYGNLNLLVMDGGEDKADDDPKNGGLFVSEAYRDAELTAIEALPVPAGINLSVCHIPLFAPSETSPQYARFSAILEKWNIKLEIAGHEHYLDLVRGTAFDTLVAGGPTDEDGFVACRIDVTGDTCTITAMNDSGEIVRTYGPISLK